jgi:putative SOS response-associated peptidase YedK
MVRYDAKAGERSLDVMRWGFVPFWAKDIKVGFANINAKAEGIENRPAFRRRSSGAVALCRWENFYQIPHCLGSVGPGSAVSSHTARSGSWPR